MNSYLTELVWFSLISLEEQQILRWTTVQESCSLSQVYELIPEGAGLVLLSGMEEQQILRWSRIEESSPPSQVSPVSGMEEQQILRMSSYLNELVWSSPVSEIEEEQILRWSRKVLLTEPSY